MLTRSKIKHLEKKVFPNKEGGIQWKIYFKDGSVESGSFEKGESLKVNSSESFLSGEGKIVHLDPILVEKYGKAEV